MNEEYEWDQNVDMVCGPEMRISEMEVSNEIKAMKLGKAAGCNGIAADHFNASGVMCPSHGGFV